MFLARFIGTKSIPLSDTPYPGFISVMHGWKKRFMELNSVLLTDRKWTIPLSYTFSPSNAWATIFFAALYMVLLLMFDYRPSILM
jgi:hypothetical protein